MQCGQINNCSSLLLSSLLLLSRVIESIDGEDFGITDGFSSVLFASLPSSFGDILRNHRCVRSIKS